MIYEARVVDVIKHKAAQGITCTKEQARPIFLERADMLKVNFFLLFLRWLTLNFFFMYMMYLIM